MAKPGGGGGGPNLQKMIQQANKLQRDMAAAQEALAAESVTGQAGNGLVTVAMSGSREVQSITVDPSVVDPDDIETLQDLLVVAVRAALVAVDELAEERMAPLSQGMGGLNLPGLL